MKHLNENLKWKHLTSAFGWFQKLNSIRLLITCGSKLLAVLLFTLNGLYQQKVTTSLENKIKSFELQNGLTDSQI